MLKNDKWIIEQATKRYMITPFEDKMVREVEDDYGNLFRKVLSYGTGSYGYDLRLSPSEFFIFKHIPGTVINPKDFNRDNLEQVKLNKDDYGEFFIIPAHSYGLGVSLERVHIPDNITTICMGKSSYARCGLIANITPGEATWQGHFTLEFSNSSSADCRIYANEGVVQLLFLEGDPCDTTYSDRRGKYQDQPEKVVIPRV